MKIGIINFHNSSNYGAILQSYALQEVVRQFSENVEIIDYVNPEIVDKYHFESEINSISKLSRSILSLIISYKDYRVKKRKADIFRKRHMNITNIKYYHSNDINGYDVYISGSDQVWNPHLTNYDNTYFLPFTESNTRKISYAASIGLDFPNDKEFEFLKSNIHYIDFLSVRESSAKKIIQSISKKEVAVVLDPTLLISNDEWEKLITHNKKNKYLLIYSFRNDKTVERISKFIADRFNLKIIQITDAVGIFNDNWQRIRRVGPIDFLSLLKNASFIVTNSFHATAFSINFNKNFIAVPSLRQTRIISLLNLLQLSDRMITDVNEIPDDFEFIIDYKIPNEILEEERKESIKFLKTALHY